MIKIEIAENNISVFCGPNRVDAAIVRQGARIDVQFNGTSVSVMDILAEL